MSLTEQLQTAQEGVVFIGATERLCREMRQQRALKHSDTDHAGWMDEVIIKTLMSWLKDEWLGLLPDQQLLHQPQYLTLCKQIIDKSKEAESCISTTALARTFQKAHSLCKDYQISMDREHFLFKPESESFLRWSSALDLKLSGSDYVVEVELPSLMQKALEQGKWRPPAKLVLVGLFELSTSQQRLISALEGHGTEVSFMSGFNASPKATETKLAQTFEDELTFATRAAAEILMASGDDPLTAPRMAIVVPSIDDCRDQIVDALEKNIAIHALMISDKANLEDRLPFAFAGGEPLDRFGVIRAGLDILQLRESGNDIELVSRIIRTQFMTGIVEERSARAQIDIALRSNTGRHVSINQIIRACERYMEQAPILGQRIKAVANTLKEGDNRRLPSGWASFFESVLVAMGWPDLHNVHSYHYQAWKAWTEVFDVLRSMDNQLGKIPVEPAFMWLRELTSTRRFSPRKPWHTPLQILSYPDAIGLHFDFAWVVGMDSNAIPGHKAPNPMIPVHLQVQAGILHASSEGVLSHAEKVIPYLQGLAKQLSLSAAMHSHDGTPLTPTALIDWSTATVIPAMGDLLSDLFQDTVRPQIPEKDLFPPVDSEERTTIQGGVTLLADFAQDPFVAALRHRLHLKEFPVTKVGLDAATQGTVTHACLKEFWLRVKSRDHLLRLSESETKELVKECVSAAIQKEKLLPVSRYGHRLVTLEQARNERLIFEWLELERERTDNFEVVGVEVPVTVDIGGIQLNVDIDRIDKIHVTNEHGVPVTKVIPLDYKTGSNIPLTSLNSTKLTEPQMPIYAAFVDYSEHGNVDADGAAFAQVVGGAPRFHIRSNWTNALVPTKRAKDYPTNDETWIGQLKAWRDGLTELSISLQSGEAKLLYGPLTYLGYHEYLAPLMRMSERGKQ